MVKRYELTDAQWQRIAALLPGKTSDPGPDGCDNRLFVNGVLWVLRSGAHWHDLPERYGKWKSVHTRFSRWAKSGTYGSGSSRSLPRTARTSTSCSTPLWSAPTSRRRPEKGGPKSGSGAFPRRIDHQDPHAGRRARPPAALHPHRRAGRRYRPRADAVGWLKGAAVIADKAYDSDALRQSIADAGMLAVIPSNRSRNVPIPHDTSLYKDATASNAASTSSSTSGASQPASTAGPPTSSPSSTSQLP